MDTIKLNKLSAREAIADSLYRAVLAYDINNVALLDSALTSDIVFEIGDFMRFEGLEEIKTNNFASVSLMDTGHLIGNVRIDVAEDGQTARVGAFAMHNHFRAGQGAQGGETANYLVGSLYDIEAVRQSDGKDELWKIRRWKMLPRYVQGDQSVMQPGA